MIFDCAIIGGGPAGLNAALVLGRSRRNVALFDNHHPRNVVTDQAYGFITHDGVNPRELRNHARQEILAYPSVQLIDEKVIDVKIVNDELFELVTGNGDGTQSRKLILATGLDEALPNVEGIEHYYGKSLFSCPYCDGWERRDEPLIVIAENERGAHMCKLLYNWSKDIVLCTNGIGEVTAEDTQLLEQKGIQVNTKRIKNIEGKDGWLEKVHFHDGSILARETGFIVPEWTQRSNFGALLGCERNSVGGIITDHYGRTSVDHIYAAGETIFVSQIVISAGEGSKAAIGVNTDLTNERFYDF